VKYVKGKEIRVFINNKKSKTLGWGHGSSSRLPAKTLSTAKFLFVCLFLTFN
jgi:hypothetical protein